MQPLTTSNIIDKKDVTTIFSNIDVIYSLNKVRFLCGPFISGLLCIVL